MHTTAIPQWEKAVEIDPNLVNAYYNLGLVYQKLGKHDEAIEVYKKVLDINADDIGAHKNLGFLYHEKGMHVEAESEFAISQKLESTQITSKHE
jgi:protein O-GlcNAc transferase